MEEAGHKGPDILGINPFLPKQARKVSKETTLFLYLTNTGILSPGLEC
jgi:hypothetical protein